MTTQAINSDTADIPSVNFSQQSGDVAAPAAGRWQLFFKAGGLYARSNAGGVIGPFLVESAGLVIEEVDANPSVAATTLQFPNGTLSDQGGGTARYTPAQLLTIAEIDANPSGQPTTLQFPNGSLSDQGSGVYRYTPVAGGGSNPVGAKISRATTFAIPQNQWTAIEFTTEDQDDDGFATLGTNATRLTVPRAGWYIVTAHFTFATYSGGARYGRFLIDGGTVAYMYPGNAGSSGVVEVWGTNVLYLAQNDYVEVQAYQTPTASLNVNPAVFTILGFAPV